MFKLLFSSRAARQLQLLRSSAYRGCGLLSGFSIGRHFLLDWLLPLQIESGAELEQLYPELLNTDPECLGGVFFCNRRPFQSSCLAGELVLVIGKKQVSAYSPEISGRSRQKTPLEIEIPGKDGYW